MPGIVTADKSYMQSFSREFLFVVFYYKTSVVITIVVFFVISLFLAIILPPIYSAASKFIVSSSSHRMDPLQQDVDYDLKNKMIRVLQNQKEIIFSTPVLNKVALAIKPGATPAELNEIIENLQKSVKVLPPKGESFEGSNVFYLSYEDKDPQKALMVTKALSESYQQVSSSFAHSKATYSYDFFRKQADELYADMQRKNVKLREYEIANAGALVDIMNLESGRSSGDVGPRGLLTEANRNRERLREDLKALQVQIESLETGLKDRDIPLLMPDMEVTGRAITAYRNKIAQLQLQINEMRTQYTESFEPLQSLVKELNMTVTLLRKELSSYIDSKKIDASVLEAKLAEIDKQSAQLESQITETAQQKSTYEALKQEVDQASRVYQDTQSKMEQARMATAVNQDIQDITIVEPPELPYKPIKPHRSLIVILGLMSGVLCGLAVAMVQDYLDHTIKSPEDIERYLDIPSLGSIDHLAI